jgi:hypothetical protein
MRITKEPIPGVPIVEPKTTPRPGDRLIGYELIPDDDQTFLSPPRPSHMRTRGWVSVVLLVLFAWPLAVVPCFTSCSYKQMQRPVYSNGNIREVVGDAPQVDATA